MSGGWVGVILMQYIVNPRIRERVTVLSLCVSHSVTQQQQKKKDLEDGSLPKIETGIKMLHWTFCVPLMCQNFSFRKQTNKQKKQLVIVRPYDSKQLLLMPPFVMHHAREQIISLLPAVVMHYTIFSVVYRSAWSFPLKLLVR